MHEIMGFTLSEWGSIIAILGGIGAVITLIIKMTSIMNRLESSIDKLDLTLSGLINDSRDTRRRLETLEDKFEEHIGEAKVRNVKIKALEKEVFKK